MSAGNMNLGDVAAEVREVYPLWEWAREQADAARRTKECADEARANLATVTETVEESMEWKDVEECRETLKAAKDAAIAGDDDVIAARENLDAARKKLAKVASYKKAREIKASVKALDTVTRETKDRLAKGLAEGKIPSAVEVDPTVKTPRS